MEKSNFFEENKDLLIKLGIVAGGFLFIARPILKSIGVIKSQEEKASEVLAQQNATSIKSPFSANYYKSVKNALILTKSGADAFAKTIYDAIGFFTDDESAVYGVFRQLKSQTQVSFLAEAFYNNYGTDLYSYLAKNLNDGEMAIVNQIVNSLPSNIVQ